MKKSLREIIISNNKIGKYLTDKAGGEFAFEKCHEYADLYDFLFNSIRDKEINLLEIGIAKGGSILAWRDYFEKGMIYGVDYYPYLPMIQRQFNDSRINTYYEDAYSQNIIRKLEHIKFDIIIDDGPHDLDSQKKFIELYHKLVCPGGFLIVEDVASMEHARELHTLMSKLTTFSMIVDRNIISNYGGNEINVIGIVK